MSKVEIGDFGADDYRSVKTSYDSLENMASILRESVPFLILRLPVLGSEYCIC